MGSLWSSQAPPEPHNDTVLDLLRQPDAIDWNRLVIRLQGCPHEAAAYCHFRDASPLMRALQSSTVTLVAVQALVEAYEEALWHTDDQGRTVWHVAAHLKNDDRDRIVEYLLQYHKEGVRQMDRQQRLPLFGVQTVSVARRFIQIGIELGLDHGGVLHKDATGQSAFDTICHQIDAAQQQSPRQDDLDRLWGILCLFMETIQPNRRILHGLVERGCSPHVIQLALTKLPGQALQGDAQGRTPLLIAASNIRRDRDIRTVCIILSHTPTAARVTDAEGRLPIDLIAEQGIYDEELYDRLIDSEPRAVDTRDLRDKLFPFITAALSESSNLNTVYRLLREKPHVVDYFRLQVPRMRPSVTE